MHYELKSLINRSGRKRGSGYRSQLMILLILTNGGASSSYIRQLSGLNKDTICFNLRILKHISAIIAERKGRNVIYRLDERAFWKWLFFHYFVGTKWAQKALKIIKSLFAYLPIMMKPIKEMYTFARYNAKQYWQLKETYPELKEGNVWHVIWLLEQFRYVDQEVRLKNLSDRGWTEVRSRKRKLDGNRKVQRKIFDERCPDCGDTNLITDWDINETVCRNCGLVIREQEIEDLWYQNEIIGLKTRWGKKRRGISSHLIPRTKNLQIEKYLKDMESCTKFCKQLNRGFEKLQKTLVGMITLGLYYDFLQTCFPEILDFAAEHEIKDYEKLPFDYAIKVEKMATQLIKERSDKVEEFSKKLKSEIDYVKGCTISFKTDFRNKPGARG